MHRVYTKKNPFKPTPEVLEKIVELASLGCTQAQIARNLHLRPDSFAHLKVQHPQLHQAVMQGKAQGIAYVTSKLRECIAKGNVQAILFYLRCQAKWRDDDVVILKQLDHVNDKRNDLERVLRLNQLTKAQLLKVTTYVEELEKTGQIKPGERLNPNDIIQKALANDVLKLPKDYHHEQERLEQNDQQRRLTHFEDPAETNTTH